MLRRSVPGLFVMRNLNKGMDVHNEKGGMGQSIDILAKDMESRMPFSAKRFGPDIYDKPHGAKYDYSQQTNAATNKKDSEKKMNETDRHYNPDVMRTSNLSSEYYYKAPKKGTQLEELAGPIAASVLLTATIVYMLVVPPKDRLSGAQQHDQWEQREREAIRERLKAERAAKQAVPQASS
jgi:hypothetical protein